MLVVVLITAGITLSFKMVENRADNTAKMVENRADDTPYYYISEDMSEGAFHNVSNWTSSSGGGVGCVTTGVRPCQVIVPESSTLGDVLGTKLNSEVLAISNNRKSAP